MILTNSNLVSLIKFFHEMDLRLWVTEQISHQAIELDSSQSSRSWLFREKKLTNSDQVQISKQFISMQAERSLYFLFVVLFEKRVTKLEIQIDVVATSLCKQRPENARDGL